MKQHWYDRFVSDSWYAHASLVLTGMALSIAGSFVLLWLVDKF